MNVPENPWERLPGEPTQAFHAFSIYLDLGHKRSIEEASRIYHHRDSVEAQKGRNRDASPKKRASGRIRTWAKKYQWKTRSEEWDQKQQEVKREKQLRSIEEMVDRHINISLLIQQKVIERIKTLSAEDLENLDLVALVKSFETAIKVEREARGQPSQISQLSGPEGKPFKIYVGIDPEKI